jgi:hypothetical protein
VNEKKKKGKERKGKGREGKGREGKGREGKGREGKGKKEEGRRTYLGLQPRCPVHHAGEGTVAVAQLWKL